MTLLTFKAFRKTFASFWTYVKSSPTTKSGIYFRICNTQTGYDAISRAGNSKKSCSKTPHPLRHCSRPKPFRTVLCSDYMNKGKKKSLFTRYVKDSGQRAAFSNSSNTFFLADLSCVARICPPFSIIISSLGSDAFSYKICV